MSNDPTKTNPPKGPANGTTNGDPTKGSAQGDGAAGPATAAGAASEVEALRARAEAAERDRDQYVALLKGKTAEFENYQKRQKRIQEEEGRFALFDFALGL